MPYFRLENLRVSIRANIAYVQDNVVGRIVSKTYITTRLPKHFMLKYHGFGLSLSLIELLERNNIEDIEDVKIIYTKTNGRKIIYTCSLKQFKESQKTYQDNTFDEGDKQHFVSTWDMKKHENF